MSYRTGSFPVMADGRNVGKVTIEQNGQLFVFNCTCNLKSNDILRLAAVCDGKYTPLGVMAPEAGVLHLKKSFTKNALTSIGYHDAAAYHLIRPGEIYSETEEAEPAAAEAEPEVIPADVQEPIEYNDFPDPVEYEYEFEPERVEVAGYSEPAGKAQTPEPEPVWQHQEPAIQLPYIEPAAPQPEPAAVSAEMTPSAVSGWMNITNPGSLFYDPSIQEYCQDVSNALISEQEGHVLLAIPVSPTEPFPLMPVFCFGSSGIIGGLDYIIFKIRDGNLAL